jgi:hypothetical protein
MEEKKRTKPPLLPSPTLRGLSSESRDLPILLDPRYNSQNVGGRLAKRQLGFKKETNYWNISRLDDSNIIRIFNELDFPTCFAFSSTNTRFHKLFLKFQQEHFQNQLRSFQKLQKRFQISESDFIQLEKKFQKDSEENLSLFMCNRIFMLENISDEKNDKRTIYLYANFNNIINPRLFAFWFDYKKKKFLRHEIPNEHLKVIRGDQDELLDKLKKTGIDNTHRDFSKITSRFNYIPHDFLLKVVRGKLDEEMKKLVQLHPELPFLKGDVTDISGRQFKEISAIQYLTWELRINDILKMLEWLLECLPKNERRKALKLQFLDELNNVSLNRVTYNLNYSYKKYIIIREMNYDFLVLEALKIYVDNYKHWNNTQREKWWCEIVGGTERKMPVSLVYRMCTSKSLTEDKTVKRSMEFFNCSDKKPQNWFESKLGWNVAIYHSNQAEDKKVPSKWSAYGVKLVEPSKAKDNLDELTALRDRMLKGLEDLKKDLEDLKTKPEKVRNENLAKNKVGILKGFALLDGQRQREIKREQKPLLNTDELETSEELKIGKQ